MLARGAVSLLAVSAAVAHRLCDAKLAATKLLFEHRRLFLRSPLQAAMRMDKTIGGQIAAARVRGVALAATGNSAEATACIEAAITEAAEAGFFWQQVLSLEAMVLSGIGGAEALRRLAGMLRKMEGSPEQIADLMRSRDGGPTVDTEALLK